MYSYFSAVLGVWQGGKYRGRRVNESQYQDSRELLNLGRRYSEIQQKLGSSGGDVRECC